MSATTWQPEDPAGHAPYCAYPGAHPPGQACAASERDPATLAGKPSRAWLRAHPDGSYSYPLILAREDLDLSGLRAHCRAHHARPGRTLPRSNADLAGWHAAQHHRYGAGHKHPDPPFVMIRLPGSGTFGQNPRPAGWYTGAGAVTPAQLRERWLDRHPPAGDGPAAPRPAAGLPGWPRLRYRQAGDRTWELAVQAGPKDPRVPIGTVRKQGSLPSMTRWYGTGNWDGAQETTWRDTRGDAAAIVWGQWRDRQAARAGR